MVKLSILFFLLVGAINHHSVEPTASAKNRYVSVQLSSTHLLYNHGVGNEWNHFLSVNDQILSIDEKSIFKLNKRAPFVIEAHAVENDKDYPDIGTQKFTLNYSDLGALDQDLFKVNVVVVENSGRLAGKMAEWVFHFKVSRVKKP